MGKGREFLDRIYALEDQGDVRAFDDYGFHDKVGTLGAEGRATCLSLTKEPYHLNEKIDGWVCVLRVTRPGIVP
ncbi:MAG: hypothetical protein BMS9Abin01_2481 [Gammaproteobacteria bacterium]|nr:MAG: hypothetical protein BMS9Abin01_2481 [Gammaproteobacteria bacterium]